MLVGVYVDGRPGRPVGPVLYIFIPRIWTNITLSLPNSDLKHFCSICILLYENLRGSYLLDKYWFTDVLQKSSIKICGHWGLFDSMMLLLKKGVFFGETDLAWHQAPLEKPAYLS